MNKGFIVGLLMMPAIMALLIVVFHELTEMCRRFAEKCRHRSDGSGDRPAGSARARGHHRSKATRAPRTRRPSSATRPPVRGHGAAVGVPLNSRSSSAASTDLQHEKQWLIVGTLMASSPALIVAA